MRPSRRTEPPEKLIIEGMPISLGDRIRRLPRWMWFIIVVALIPVVSVPAVGLARYTTSSSSYCLKCHATGETPNRGVRSLVHPGFGRVTCIDCHAKPGHVVFEGYVKGFMAEPERVNENCVRCHKDMMARNDTQDFKFNFLSIQIPHKFHLDLGASCTTCHSNVAHDLRSPPTNRPTMAACDQCHARAQSCTKCHAQGIPSAALPVPAAAATGDVTDGRVLFLRSCSACHGQKGDRLPQAELSSRQFLEALGETRLYEVIAGGHGVMPGFSKDKGGEYTEEQIKAIAAYLGLSASPRLGDSQDIYESSCIVCHGADGNRVAEAKLGSREFLDKTGDEALKATIFSGKGGMPAFGKDSGGPLTNEDISALVGYLRSRAR